MYVVGIYSGIADGGEFTEELYAHRIHKLCFLHLFTDLFR